MPQDYYSLVTNVGLIKEAEAGQIGANPINLTEIAVGDGNGSYYEPDSAATSLVNELYRASLTSAVLDANNPNQLIIEGVIPEEAGPFYIREVGIFDSDGDLFAIGKYPETFKSNYESGSGKRLYIRLIVAFVSIPNVEIVLSENINFDPNFEANLNIELANRLKISENLADLNDVDQARNNLEVYSKDYLNSRIGRNHIINGNFDIWQRGVSFSQVNAFGPDRWRIWNSGATVSFTRQDFGIGQIEVPHNPKFYININCTVADDSVGLLQYIEDVRTLVGKKAILSFYAKADSNRILSTRLDQNFGSGGSSEELGIDVKNHNLTTSWQKFTHIIDVPTISGKTIGTGSFLKLVMVNPNNETSNIDIAQVQLEEGEIVTDFEQRNIVQELALCQRYFCSSQVQDGTNLEEFYVLPVSAAAQINRQTVPFPVLMRATPAMSVVRTSGTANTGTFAEINARGFRKSFGGGQYEYAEYTWTADSEL